MNKTNQKVREMIELTYQLEKIYGGSTSLPTTAPRYRGPFYPSDPCLGPIDITTYF
ncbi:hypothetical protein L3V43_13565 [Pseudoalteromonas sp. L23]|uniref:hypothetical protein n=1 Tax=unclassified Pseudoalteromonas TaxID=194690 RepID=UPI001EF0394C|nr:MULTISPECIES: hypothetical protein [unclassified Pseudoalteromonas]MCF7514541.1 hypothetical protein [Pseudoalteromonas sp. L7]MCF7526680.1 hypothetical protein [Pseudoalteromonas sp. L23]MCX2766390.1 hypothetical protein [Pseudoalteromonas sp. B530]